MKKLALLATAVAFSMSSVAFANPNPTPAPVAVAAPTPVAVPQKDVVKIYESGWQNLFSEANRALLISGALAGVFVIYIISNDGKDVVEIIGTTGTI